MNTECFVCIDTSGSTNTQTKYWNNVKQIIDNVRKQYISVNYISWDYSAKKININDVHDLINSKNINGKWGTEPQCFIKELQKNNEKLINLIIITDGAIYNEDIKQSNLLLDGRQFNSVVVHFLNTTADMNLSVSAPFIKKTKYKLYIDNELLKEGSTENEINLNIYYNNVDLFLHDSEKILYNITLQNIGSSNDILKNQLLKLQKNLLFNLSNFNYDKNLEIFDNIRQIIKTDSYTHSYPKFIELINKSNLNIGSIIERNIRLMLQECNSSNNFSFDLLKPGRLNRAKIIPKVTINDVKPIECQFEKFECPITLDYDLPCCLVNNNDPILENLDKKYLDLIINNPLILLSDSSLRMNTINKIKSKLDHIIGFNSVKKMFNQKNTYICSYDSDSDIDENDYSENNLKNTIISPITRNEINCILSFDNNKSHIKSVNYTLANIFFGNKLVGIPELYLFVIYKIIKDYIPYLSENIEFMNLFKNNIIYRLIHNKTNITLSGTAIEPLIKTPVDIAIWYCVNSPLIYLPAYDGITNDRLRAFNNTSIYLLELLELLNYKYDKYKILYLMQIYKAFYWMIYEKNNNTNWKLLIEAQYQNSIILDDGSIILIDGDADDDKPKLPSFKINIEQDELDFNIIYRIYIMILNNVNTKSNLLLIPTKYNKIRFVLKQDNLDSQFESRQIYDEYTIPKSNYNYTTKYEDIIYDDTIICKNTLRPYTIDTKLHKHWLKCTENNYGPIDKQLSLYNLFINYIINKKKYPTKTEFIKYLAYHQLHSELKSINTLPIPIIIFVDQLYTGYEKVLGINFKNVSVSEFIKITEKSRDKNNRINIEN